VRRFLLSQLRHRRSRTAALGLGILVAAVSFTLLTSATDTSELRVTGTVSRNFRPAYDVLVRPSDSFTAIERSQGLVQENYLSGIFGGISFKQYREIKQIPGIQVAAPIANVGYVLPFQFIPITINRFLSSSPQQSYRLRLDWLANNGLSHYPDSDQYVYYSDGRFVRVQEPGGVAELSSRGRQLPICVFNSTVPSRGGRPFNLESGVGMMCFSKATPELDGGTLDYGPLPPGRVGAVSTAFFPIFVSAIDPVQEARLVGLDHAVVSGRYLEPNEGAPIRHAGPNTEYRVVPVLASTKTYVDENLRVSVQRLQTPSRREILAGLSSPSRVRNFVEGLPGRVVGTEQFPIGRFYERLLENLSGPIRSLEISYQAYWSTASTTYRRLGTDRLEPNAVRNAQATFDSSYYGSGWAPQEIRDVQFRRVFQHEGSTQFSGELLNIPALHVIGRFDPSRLPGSTLTGSAGNLLPTRGRPGGRPQLAPARWQTLASDREHRRLCRAATSPADDTRCAQAVHQRNKLLGHRCRCADQRDPGAGSRCYRLGSRIPRTDPLRGSGDPRSHRSCRGRHGGVLAPSDAHSAAGRKVRSAAAHGEGGMGPERGGGEVP
jgi:putative ABC transport system permease protein